MKRALVCAAGGLIGSHLLKLLKDEGYWVRGVDLEHPPHASPPSDEFLLLDLRHADACRRAVTVDGAAVEEVYQLAPDPDTSPGEDGWRRDYEVLSDSLLTTVHLLNASAERGVERFFFASSASVYPHPSPGGSLYSEEDAYPAQPRSERGWEKLFGERLVLALSRDSALDVRIARFENCYGPGAGRSQGCDMAARALCRRVAETPDGGELEVRSAEETLSSHIYVADLCAAIRMLMGSDLRRPVNISTDRMSSMRDLVQIIADAAGKRIDVRCVDGGPRVPTIRYRTALIRSTGWRPVYSLEEGLCRTYAWVTEQQLAARLARESMVEVDR